MNDITNDRVAGGRGPLGRPGLRRPGLRRPGLRRPGLRRAGLLAAAAAGVALLVTACSGGSTTAAVTTPPATPAASTPAPTTAAPTPAATAPTAYQKALAYAQCMRTHGVPNWPDPASDGSFSGSVDTSTAQYVSAHLACGHLLPNDGVLTQAQTQQALATLTKYAACMRSHGIPKYPNPDPRNVQADLTGPGYRSAQDLNVSMQQFNSASQACLKFRPGYGGTS